MTYVPAKFFCGAKLALALLLVGGVVPLSAAESVASEPLAASRESGVAERLLSLRFQEPLLSVASAEAERLELTLALASYGESGDRGVLEGFLERYPASGWRAAILGNLGFMAAGEGRYSQALLDLRRAWEAGRKIEQVEVKRFVDRVVGELIQLETRLGHREAVARLLAEVEGRELSGSASEALAFGREGLWQMENPTAGTFLCGPLALAQMLEPHEALDSFGFRRDFELSVKTEGYSLAELLGLAQGQGYDLVALYRESGAPIPVPSVVHWKTGHYAAIVETEGSRYRIRDAALGRDQWITGDVLESEGSGYFLAKAGEEGRLANGWRLTSVEESGQVIGAGVTPDVDNTQTPPCDKPVGGGCSACEGGNSGDEGAPTKMLRYSVQSMLASLALDDTPLNYRPSKGPEVPLTFTYSQREAYQPANFTYANAGPKWNYTGISYIVDDPSAPGVNAQRYLPGGGTRKQEGYNAGSQSFAPDAQDQSVLVLVKQNPITYERRKADGSKDIYSHSDGQGAWPRKVFLTQTIDEVGNTLTYTWDTRHRLTQITDANGKKTTIAYNHGDPLKITGITDPYGRKATIEYDTTGRLLAITDVLGLESRVAYRGASEFIEQLTTPYGTSRFDFGESGTTRWVEMTNPEGETERIETRHSAPGIPYSETQVPQGITAFNAYINSRNTFYWDATANARHHGDYTRAYIKHWHHERTNTNLTAGVLESVKNPLENRVWFSYPGQAASHTQGTCNKPSAVARVLPDGSTQLVRMSYNEQGNLTSRIDPKGRETLYEYAANGTDLLRVRQKTQDGEEVLLELAWDKNHRPLTVKDAAGQTSRYTWDKSGQLLTVTNALSETTKYQYDSQGRLTKVTNPQGKTQAQYTYDAQGNLASETDSEGHTLKFAYDVLGRRIRTTWPDGSTEEIVWDKFDVARVKDRKGRITRYTHDAARRLTEVTDAENRTVRYGYQENGQLIALTDAKGNTTRWERDLQGRVTAKVYPDGGREQTTYDTAGRTAERIDPQGQITHYQYGIDDRIAGIAYPNAKTPTSAVAYTDDVNYPRVIRQTDGLGETVYAYVPAGKLGAGRIEKIDGPYRNDEIIFAYDKLGRSVSRSIGGKGESYVYDKLGRVTSHGNPLGQFDYSYLGQTGQESEQKLVQGLLGLGGYAIDSYYENNQNDRRLKAIIPWSLKYPVGKGASTQLYQSDATGNIIARGEVPGRSERYQYDNADRLRLVEQRPWSVDWKAWLLHLPAGEKTVLTVLLTQLGKLDGLTETYAYTLDAADNLTEVKKPTAGWTGQVNASNQYTLAQGKAWQYDESGNLVDDGNRSYAWDGANRLVEVIDRQTGERHAFEYDGQSRLTVKKSYANAVVKPTETRYLWCGDRICQKRDGNDTVQATYYHEGEQQGNTPLYYVKDHLGSVTDVIDAQGKRLGELDYGPYGESVKSAGQTTDFRYAGMFHLPEAGLYLTHYRLYDPNTGRWLNRDPIGETGGFNLYGYVGGNPVNQKDILGLSPAAAIPPIVATVCTRTPSCVRVVMGIVIQLGRMVCLATAGDNDEAPPNNGACDGQCENEGTSSDSGDKDPSTPTGQRGSPLDVKPGTNKPTTIGDRPYTGHALDRMQGRGVPPSAVEDAIRNGESSPGNQSGTTVHTGSNGVTVVTGDRGQVITVISR
jgi:RHS repeat-associated protein